MTAEKRKLPITERNEIAKDTIELKLGLDKKMDYKAGHYVTIKVDKEIKDGRGPTRAFSLSSSPNNKEYISTCFRLPDKHSEFKEYITTCPLKTEVEVTGPLGEFHLPENTRRSIVMVAGGVGVVPFIGMIRHSTENKSGHKIKLLYTDKSEERMAYYDELVRLEEENENFSFANRFKRVDEGFIRENTKVGSSIFYICGTPQLVEGVRKLLEEMGVEPERIKFENFSGY